jgi:hypothetical protein
MEEVQELEAQLQVFETVMQRDIAECVTDMETTFQSTEVDLSGSAQISPFFECHSFILFLVLQTLSKYFNLFMLLVWSMSASCPSLGH